MNKGELISKMADDAGITKAQATEAYDSFVEAVTTSLQKDEKLTLIGFGTFSSSIRAARKGINPATRQPIDIPEKKVIKFKAGKALQEKM